MSAEENVADLVARVLRSVAIEETTKGHLGPPRDNPNSASIRIGEAAKAIAEALRKSPRCGAYKVADLLRDGRWRRFEVEDITNRGEMDQGGRRFRARLSDHYGQERQHTGEDPDDCIRKLWLV